MRFCDLFTSYKIGLKNIKSTIPLTKLPIYRKILLILFLGCIITSFILQILFPQRLFSIISLAIGVLTIIIFIIIDSTKKNLQEMLDKHYQPYSDKRIKMLLKILKKYNIDIHSHDTINKLIEEAKLAQKQCDYFSPIQKPLNTLVTISVPIISFAARKFGDYLQISALIPIAIQTIIIMLLSFLLIFTITPILKDILYMDYNKYEELIYDLRQIDIFYAKYIMLDRKI